MGKRIRVGGKDESGEACQVWDGSGGACQVWDGSGGACQV